MEKNDAVDDCVENTVLQADLLNWDWLESARPAFSEAFIRDGILLSSFNGWLPQAVTRFTLVTRNRDSFPELHIDADHSTPSDIVVPTRNQAAHGAEKR